MFFRSFSGIPLRPYIETHLNGTLVNSAVNSSITDEDDDFDPDDLLSPPYPCLVDLAVVLIELHKAKSLESLAEVYGIPVVEEMDITARYILVREVFKHCQLDITDQTRIAISMCLDPNIGVNDDGDEIDEHGLRDVIYQEVVRRLEDELEQGFSELSIDKLDTLVRNLDLANGGQPIRLEQKGSLPETRTANSKQKRRHPEDPAGRQVRFLALPDPNISDHSYQSATSKLNIPAKENGPRTQDKENRSSSLNHLPAKHSGHSTTRPDTIRVLNIPDDLLELELKTELERLFGSICKIHSLARASRDMCWHKCATVTFPAIRNDELSKLIRAETADLRGPFNFHYDTNFFGLSPLHDAGDDAIVDIIAIEGLGTNPFSTFRAPQGDEMWLRDYLKDNFQSSRVLLYGYDSKVLSSRTDQNI
ncbi:uncharacterized protein F4822DRAFT_239765 [Hypoxylon trugodes]|uniref:uncharacterized protein n=1 Tax=Hypoxylon trugodes TaxID=326681 RepID=UPI002199FF6B|nr:uncharacterized protein F4822DRAFT_239765 [Hypoxylon trugodes]KAI1388244.1 hypothetical protein F4822DRAFT_239765 [Hypoxylon trugodes]